MPTSWNSSPRIALLPLALWLSPLGVAGCDEDRGAGRAEAEQLAALDDDWDALSGTWRKGPDGSVLLVEGSDGGSLVFLPEAALDFELSTTLRVAPAGLQVGLAFEARGAERYAALAYDAEGAALALVRVNDGRYQVVESVPLELDHGRPHALAIASAGGELVAHVDGQRVLAAPAGGSTRAGRVGLWAWGAGSAEFRDVKLERRVRPLPIEAIRPLFAEGLSELPGGDLRVEWPRADLALQVDGFELSPGEIPPCWATFRATPEGALMLGEAVAVVDEVDALLDAALAHEIRVTAIGPAFPFARPPVVAVRMTGHGPLTLLAAGAQSAFRASQEQRKRWPEPPASFPLQGGPVAKQDQTPLDADAIGKALAAPAEREGAVVQVSFPRQGTLEGVRLDAALGIETRATFAGSAGGARVSGQLALTPEQVAPALSALRRVQFHVVALGDRIGSEPPYVFVRYWARGAAVGLATRLRAVLDSLAESPPARREAAD